MKTSKIEKILFCIQPDVTNMELVERASDIARKKEAAVTVFHSIGDYPEDTSEWWNVRNPEDLKRQIVEERQGRLDDVVQRFTKHGVQTVDSRLTWGRPFLEITRETMRHEYDLVMITARRTSNLSRMLLDSPSMDLLQHCPCRLWISRTNNSRRSGRILAAVGGKDTTECRDVDMKVVSTAAAIAEAEEGELHIIRALPLYGGKGLKGNQLRSDLARIVDDAREQFLEQCKPVISEYSVDFDAGHLHFETGELSHVIVDTVKQNRIDLVVIGTMPPKGAPVFQFGNQAVTVLDHIDCDMVGVKPDEFVSLVEQEGEGA